MDIRYSGLVSCIINFLNAERFLEEAIESVLSQTYQHWELLLVDDGSADGSTSIALDYVRKYPERIYYFEHEQHQNQGTSASRNLGIKNTKGKYVAFLDADDVWLPQKLEKQVMVLDQHPEVGMTYGPLFYWHSWTGKEEDYEKDFLAEIQDFPPNTVIRSPQYLTLFIQEKILIPSPCCILTKKAVLDKIGGFEEDFRDLFDDQVFVAKVSLETPILLTHEPLEKYRKHPDSCTALISDDKVHQFRETYLNWVENYVKTLDIQDTALLRAIWKELLPYRNPYLYRLFKLLDLSKFFIHSMKNLLLRKIGNPCFRFSARDSSKI
jgi:glycosyltransferase involved in cell wall biosynthesis